MSLWPKTSVQIPVCVINTDDPNKYATKATASQGEFPWALISDNNGLSSDP